MRARMVSCHAPMCGPTRERQPPDLDGVGAEDRAFGGKENRRAVGRVGDADVDHHRGFSAERDDAPVGERPRRRIDVVHRAAERLGAGEQTVAVLRRSARSSSRSAPVASRSDRATPLPLASSFCNAGGSGRLPAGRREGVGHADVSDELRRVGKDDAAGRVVPVVVAVEHVAHGLFEALRDFLLEPQRELAADRVGHDDALRRHQEHVVVIVVLRAIKLPGDVRDAAGGRRRGLLRPARTAGTVATRIARQHS